MKLVKSIVIGNLVIPAGTDLVFDEHGIADYKGMKVDLTMVPDDCVGCSDAKALEAITLKSRGQLGIDLLVSTLITILASCPPEDRNRLRLVLSNARQASTSNTPSATFKKLMKIDK